MQVFDLILSAAAFVALAAIFVAYRMGHTAGKAWLMDEFRKGSAELHALLGNAWRDAANAERELRASLTRSTSLQEARSRGTVTVNTPASISGLVNKPASGGGGGPVEPTV
jgi:hypothetical protein